jgi:DNA ligase-1
MGKLHGTKANLTKEGYLEELLFAGEPNETKFVIRFLQKNFKMGAAEMCMQSSLARTFYLEKEWGPEHNNKKKTSDFVAAENLETVQHWEKSLQKVINQYPFHAKVIESLQSIDSIDELKEFCHLVPGIPCKPQLAKPTKDISIIFKRFENMPFTCEFKYDGLRGQIHFKDGKCDIFSR